jgi:thiamine kinase
MQELLKRLALQTGLAEVHINRQLSNEATGSRWLIDTAAGRMVLTVDSNFAAEIGLDRSVQFELLQSAFARQLGPEPIFLDSDAGVMLVGYIPGRNLNIAQLSEQKMLGDLARLLVQVHSMKCVALSDSLTLTEKVALYAQHVGSREVDRLFSELTKLLDGYAVERQVLCHNDVHHGNIISGAGLALIDWDYAGIGSAWFDLATVIGHHDLNPGARAYFLDAYFGARNLWTRDQLRDWLKIYRLVVKSWELCTAT